MTPLFNEGQGEKQRRRRQDGGGEGEGYRDGTGSLEQCKRVEKQTSCRKG